MKSYPTQTLDYSIRCQPWRTGSQWTKTSSQLRIYSGVKRDESNETVMDLFDMANLLLWGRFSRKSHMIYVTTNGLSTRGKAEGTESTATWVWKWGIIQRTIVAKP